MKVLNVQYLLLLILLFVTQIATAQYKLSGKVFASGGNKELLTKVTIANKTANDLSFTDDNGFYTIMINKGDTLEFSRLGFFSYTYFVGDVKGPVNRNITLSEKKNILQEVKVSGLSKYQRDSIDRNKTYDKALSTEQVTTIMSPVTSLYQQFSKKYRDLRKFQSQYADMEKQKFIDTKYTYEMVSSITKLEGDAVAYFMNTYPMEYNFARTSSALEVKLWIKHNYKDYALMGKEAKVKLEFEKQTPAQK
jgi:hypothetical protein